MHERIVASVNEIWWVLVYVKPGLRSYLASNLEYLLVNFFGGFVDYEIFFSLYFSFILRYPSP
jgi:hypothetical protein